MQGSTKGVTTVPGLVQLRLQLGYSIQPNCWHHWDELVLDCNDLSLLWWFVSVLSLYLYFFSSFRSP